MDKTREEAWLATKGRLTFFNVATYLQDWGTEGAQLTLSELARLSNSSSDVLIRASCRTWLATEVVRHGQNCLEEYRKLYPEAWGASFDFGNKLQLILPEEDEYCGLLSYRFGAPTEHPDRGGLRITLETQSASSIMGGVIELPIWTVGEIREERDDSVGMVNCEYYPLTAADFAPVGDPDFQEVATKYHVASNSLAYALVAAHAYHQGQLLTWLIESRL